MCVCVCVCVCVWVCVRACVRACSRVWTNESANHTSAVSKKLCRNPVNLIRGMQRFRVLETTHTPFDGPSDFIDFVGFYCGQTDVSVPVYELLYTGRGFSPIDFCCLYEGYHQL